jgi:hypothetical protein
MADATRADRLAESADRARALADRRSAQLASLGPPGAIKRPWRFPQ